MARSCCGPLAWLDAGAGWNLPYAAPNCAEAADYSATHSVCCRCVTLRERAARRKECVAIWNIESRIDSIFTSLVNFCWSLFKWSLLLAFVGALAVGGYLYFRLDDEIRRQVQLRFANHYVDFDVHVGSARFDSERGIAIDNLSLTPKTTDGSSACR